MKKPADIPVDAGTSHSNTKKKKAVLEHETDYVTSSSEDSNIKCETSDDEYTTYDTKTIHSERWFQKKLNDSIRDLGLPKDFLCLWDGRYRGNVVMSLERGCRNVINDRLGEPSKVLLPPLYIKLGLMKQFVKALNKKGQCFQYIMSQFPQLFDANSNEGIFDGPQIQKLLKDDAFFLLK